MNLDLQLYNKQDKKQEERFEKIAKIGEGTYGEVFQAKDFKLNRIVAIKKIKFDQEDEGIPSTALREVAILKELKNHPNIVELLDVQYQPQKQKMNLIFEYLDYDLRKFLDKNRQGQNVGLPLFQVKSFMHQLLNGLNYCHKMRIFHRDLKPQNLLLTQDGILKIADFGLGRSVTLPIPVLTHEIETLWYRAPEILLGQEAYSFGVDMWSVGAIFGEMVTGLPILMGDSEIDQIFKIFQMFGTPNEQVWPGVTQLKYFKEKFPKFKSKSISDVLINFDAQGIDLFNRIMQYEPSKRICTKQALNHQFFDGITML